MTDTLYLVDGSSYLFRAYHAMGDLRNAEGVPTGATYNFINMIRRLREEEDPRHIAVVFDPDGDTFRKELFEEYKENRDDTPEDLKEQIPYVLDILDAMGIPRISVENFEADDVIATLTRKARKKSYRVILVSGDKDLTQLVEDRTVYMYDTKRDREMDEEYIKERYGVQRPEQMIDYLAMQGDSADNIPGISGIGEKSVQTLLKTFDSMEEVLENPDEIESTRIRNRIKEADEDVLRYKNLIKLRSDVPVDREPEDFVPGKEDVEKLRDIYRELEFSRLLDELPDSKTLDESLFTTVRTRENLETLVEEVKEDGAFVFDFETSGLDPHRDEIVGWGLATSERSYYVPVRHETGEQQLDPDRVREKLAPLLEDPEIQITGQNLKFDYQFLLAVDRHMKGIVCDTMLVSYLLRPGRSSHNLKSLAREHLNHSLIDYEEVTESYEHFGKVPIEEATRYGCEDVAATRAIADKLLSRLSEEGLTELLEGVELPLIPILARMEWRGIKLDPEELNRLKEELNKKLEKLEQRVHEEAGTEFNLNSPQQLQDVLFETLDLEPVRETKTGYSTDADTLEELRDEHPVPELILEYRSLSKLVNTYADKLPEQIHAGTGRLHTSFEQTRTATGRLSSREPNLQNIPVRTEEGRRIRRAFVAEEGWKLLSADYSQIELRVLAHVSGDRSLVNAFRQGADIHRTTAADMFDVPENEVDNDLREAAKTINYGIVYGISAHGLQQRLDINHEEAQEYIDRYLERYEGVNQYMEEIVEKAHRQEYVETLLGRRRYIRGINSDDWNTRNFAERAAINTPIQGSAADLIKLAMIDVEEMLKEGAFSSRQLLQIHDEIMLEVPEGELMTMEARIEGTMNNAMELDVPLKVDMGTGDNWAELK